MTEKQRIKLEELINDFEVTVILAALPENRFLVRKERDKAHDRITDHLDTIQGVTHGTVELGPCDCWDCTRRRDKQRMGAR
tara:strand:- start:674 stop:916 length:243 start_codon:yes stop_codon:yes gene_type:complete